MPWLRVDDGLDSDGRIEAITNEAVGILVRAASYCTRNQTDGIVPDRWVNSRVSRQRSARERVVGQLVGEGLWERVDGGYRVAPLHDDNDRLLHGWTRADIEARRSEDARKKRAQRARRSGGEDTPEGEAESQPGPALSSRSGSNSREPSSELLHVDSGTDAAKRTVVPSGHREMSGTGRVGTGNEENSNCGVDDPWALTWEELRPELQAERAHLRPDSQDQGKVPTTHERGDRATDGWTPAKLDGFIERAKELFPGTHELLDEEGDS